jgi:hypothetical protein
VLVLALGERVFRSPWVGRIAALLFFAHGSLSLLPWLASLPTVSDAPAAIWSLERYLTSPFPYRGEDFGLWSQNVYITQRHLVSGMGIALVALLFTIDRLPGSASPEGQRSPLASASRLPARGVLGRLPRALPTRAAAAAALRRPATLGYVVAGVLLGLLPLWNSSAYVGAAATMAAIFLLLRNRLEMLVLALAAAVVSLPQLLSVRPPGIPATSDLPRLEWGYVVEDPTPLNVAVYLGFIFGLKLLPIAFALLAGTSTQRRLFLAVTTPAIVAFVVQLTLDIINNHKLLNMWLVLANAWAAAGLVALWRWGSARDLFARGAARATAVVLVVLIAAGGLIDLMPIKNERTVPFPMHGDTLYEWVQEHTDPNDTFLSQIYVTHPILFAGRRLFYGFPGFTGAAGYDVDARERVYREMLQSRSPRAVVQLLQQNDIAYVAVDDTLRNGVFEIVTDVNEEEVLAAHLERVFEDVENRYEHLAIYRVPTDPNAWQGLPGPAAGNAFTGGVGSDPGRFSDPRGVGVGADGSIVVADTGNDRLQRFAPDGTFVAAWGEPGSADGQMEEPSGVAVDAAGHVFVADTVNHRVQEFDAENRFVRAWTGPELAFYGPRDVAVGDDGALYVLDQGRARVVREGADGAVTEFGTLGAGPGQLDDPTGLAVAGGFVYVADPANARIQIWDGAGTFVRSEPVAAWQDGVAADVAADPDRGTIYASAPGAEVLVFDIEGGSLPPLSRADDAPAGTGSLTVTPDGEVIAVDVGGNRLVRLPGAPR